MVDILSGSVNILKHSARLFLQVIVGSKRMWPFVLLASWFLSFLCGDRERLSWWFLASRGFILGAIRCMRDRASAAQAWGFLQPLARSWEQSVQGHCTLGMCGKIGAGVRKRADVETRSATVVVACFLRRHLAVDVVRGRVVACGWYHAGIWALRWGDIQMAARFVPCFLAALSILAMSLFRRA